MSLYSKFERSGSIFSLALSLARIAKQLKIMQQRIRWERRLNHAVQTVLYIK
jgi:hypothetical protein